jgi:hypothetical protein
MAFIPNVAYAKRIKVRDRVGISFSTSHSDTWLLGVHPVKPACCDASSKRHFLQRMYGEAESAMALHNVRLNQLNEEHRKYSTFALLLKLYRKGKLRPFKAELASTFQITLNSELPQDINAALYTLISQTMRPFAFPGQSARSVELFTQITIELAEKDRVAWDAFIEEIIGTGYLKNLQQDCLQVYPRILEAELPMRPALFLDFDHEYHESKAPMRVSIARFDDFKDLFKDISEIIARQLVLIAAINNLLKRGDHNTFKPRPPMREGDRDHTPKNLSEFANVDFGRKQAFIDDPWYVIADEAVNNRLRNAIAHCKAEYDDGKQMITYFPRKEGLAQEKAETVSFLEFMRWFLLAYREMHQMHHLIKSLYYYRYLIQKKT